MSLLVLDAHALRAALPMRAAIDSQRAAFRALSDGTAEVPARAHLSGAAPESRLLVMPGRLGERALGAKLIALYPGNRARGAEALQGLVVLLDPASGAPRALLDGAFLTAWRTGAASGLATELLARADAHVGAVLGTGPQARTQALAIATARPLDELRLWGRTPARAHALADRLGGELEARIVVAASARDAVRDADVVCTATSATEPVLGDAWLAPGAHVNAIGSFTPAMRELETRTIARARVFVDRVADALEEAGELLEARRAGASAPEHWHELGRLAAGAIEGRRASDELTLFKSVGNAVQDLAAGAAALERAQALGLGEAIAWRSSPA